MWKLGHGVDRELAEAGEALAVSVGMGEGDLLDVERGKSAVGIPLRQAGGCEFLANGLGNDEPARLVNKGGVAVLFACVVTALV